jgi:hypothetical protein
MFICLGSGLDYSLNYSVTCTVVDFVDSFGFMPVLSRPFAGACRLAGCALGLIRIMSKHNQGVWGVR